MELKQYIETVVREAKQASAAMRAMPADHKNRVLVALAAGIVDRKKDIQRANQADCERGRGRKLSDAFLDRLLLTDRRIDDMVRSVREIAAMEDPVGRVEGVRRPQGFVLEKVRACA